MRCRVFPPLPALFPDAQPQFRVQALEAERTLPQDLLSARSLLFVAPENLGSLSGAMKECLDRCYYPCLDKLNGKPFSAVISAGSSGTGALKQLRGIAAGWRLQEVTPAQIVRIDAFQADTGAIQTLNSLAPAQQLPAIEVARTLVARLLSGLD